ncbi:MAG: Fe3+-citrate ABC transporter substrate-binding protein [Erysipelotrichia bacterium]|nr:Fe3+-citrate ABC transporter substrate-binding protein [Erysipelotrichia bacterium]
MKRKFISFICCILTAAMMTGCGAASSSASSAASAGATVSAAAESSTIAITDHAGNTVELPKDIERIAIVGIYPLASVLTVFFNSSEKIVAMPKQSMAAAKSGLLGQLYPDLLNVQTECVSGDTVNTEELLTLNPDVVFYSASDAAIGETLRNAGFNAVALSVNKWEYNCIETLNQWISLLSEMFPEDSKADAVRKYSDDTYNMIQTRVSKLSDEEKARIFVLFQYSDTTLLTSGKNFFGQWWCDAIGAVNVAEELTNDNSSSVSMEQIYAWNPDIILVTNFTAAQPQDLYQSTIGSDDWSGIKAVQDKRIYKMPLGMYRSYTPGADTPITLMWMAKAVYPELFSDIDVTEEARDYYQTVFGIGLTDDQISSIFAPSSSAAEGF